MVAVTMNYRLGAFGFLAHSAFAAENEHRSAGNYALMDQIAALKWVQRDIHAFGGDPSRVLLYGHSAGSADTCALIASPLARGLFSRALMQSGPCYTLPPSVSDHSASVAIEQVGCAEASDVPACLRQVEAAKLALVPGARYPGPERAALEASGNTELQEECDEKGCDYNPVVDGYVLPDYPLEIIRTGRHNRVPLIVGTTSNEYSGVGLPITNNEEHRNE